MRKKKKQKLLWPLFSLACATTTGIKWLWLCCHKRQGIGSNRLEKWKRLDGEMFSLKFLLFSYWFSIQHTFAADLGMYIARHSFSALPWPNILPGGASYVCTQFPSMAIDNNQGTSVPEDFAEQKIAQVRVGRYCRQLNSRKIQRVMFHVGRSKNSPLSSWMVGSINRLGHCERTNFRFSSPQEMPK